MISVEQAINIIINEIDVIGWERLPITLSLDRVLAEDIITARDNPLWDNSAMDGYAVKAIDTKGASKDNPKILNIIEDLPAGYVAVNCLKDGEAIRIMTGAPIPDGADAVVMVEDTEKSGVKGQGATVKIFKEAGSGDNIRRQGEDFKRGDLLIKKGMVIRHIEIGVMAAVGRSFVNVHQKPKIAVVATGDELIEVDEAVEKGKIGNSNSYILSAQIKACGAEPVYIGIARDRKEDLKEKLKMASRSDCIVSSGGVSVGDFDLVKEVLREMGSEMRFWKVAMKPGKPLAFGVINGKPCFGLPGNPISSLVAFEQFVRPAILKMMGRTNIYRRTLTAVLAKDIKKKADRTHFVRGILKIDDSRYYAEPLERQGSGMLASFVFSNCLIILPKEETLFKKGDPVKVQLIDDSFLYQ